MTYICYRFGHPAPGAKVASDFDLNFLLSVPSEYPSPSFFLIVSITVENDLGKRIVSNREVVVSNEAQDLQSSLRSGKTNRSIRKV